MKNLTYTFLLLFLVSCGSNITPKLEDASLVTQSVVNSLENDLDKWEVIPTNESNTIYLIQKETKIVISRYRWYNYNFKGLTWSITKPHELEFDYTETKFIEKAWNNRQIKLDNVIANEIDSLLNQ